MSSYSMSALILPRIIRDEGVAKIVAAGFDMVELPAGDYFLDNWLTDPGVLKEALDRAGVWARSVHGPLSCWSAPQDGQFRDHAAGDPAERAAAVEATAASFVAAVAVGAEVVICHSNAPTELVSPEQAAEIRSRGLESLKILAERAGRAGIRMAVETLPIKDAARLRPGALVDDLVEMIEGLGDHVGICVDVGHCHINGEDPAQAIRTAGTQLLAVHLHDNNARGTDQHLLPGEGTIDWAAVIKAMDEIGFAGPRTFEVLLNGNTLDARLEHLSQLRRQWEE